MRPTRSDTSDMTKIALFAAMLSASSYFVIPLPFTPIVLSAHTVTVNLIALMLDPRNAAYTVIVYIVMGLIGLPVFSGGTSGPGKLFGPTGGFYFGFLFAAIAISALKGRKNDLKRYILVTSAVGVPISHLFGILFMCIHNGFNIRSAFLTVSLPFIPGDIIKCIISSLLAVSLNKLFLRLNR